MATAMSSVGRVNQSPEQIPANSPSNDNSTISFSKSSKLAHEQTKISKELLETNSFDGGIDSGFLFTMERDRVY